jgi:hypothetical protein
MASVAAGQSLADFGIPASSDNPEAVREVKNPAAVKNTMNEALGQEVTSAETTQDAINATSKGLQEAGSGAKFISTGSGLGCVAVGSSSYGSDDVTNPNLVLIAQRHAAIAALLEAKKGMAKFLNGVSIDGKQELSKQRQMIDDPEMSMANIASSSKEQLGTSINAMLKGVIVYDFQDDPSTGEVMVTVVTTPRTQGACQRSSGGGAMDAVSLQAGVAAVISEVKTQLVTPVGGRTIVVSGTGQIAWVGFGSEICRKNRNKEIQRDLKEGARETALERAERALLGTINGQKIKATSKLEEEFAKDIQQFEVVIDPEGNESTVPLADDKVTLGAQQLRVSVIGTETVGKLPPGVRTETYYTKDGNWAYAIAIYMPEATEAAKNIAAGMAANSPLRSNLGDRFKVNADGSFKVGKDGRLIPASMGNGRVTRDSDL